MSRKSSEPSVRFKVCFRDWEKLEYAQEKPWRSRNDVGILRGNEEPRLATGRAVLGS